MTPNYSGLLYQFDLLEKSASALQNEGNQIARIAQSGKANLARSEEAFQMASNLSGASPALQEQMDQFVRSQGFQLSSLEAATSQLDNNIQNVHVARIEALTGVTVADIAAQSFIKTMIEEAPDDQKAAVAELNKNPFEYPFQKNNWMTCWGNSVAICLIYEGPLGMLFTRPLTVPCKMPPTT